MAWRGVCLHVHGVNGAQSLTRLPINDWASFTALNLLIITSEASIGESGESFEVGLGLASPGRTREDSDSRVQGEPASPWTRES